MADNMTFEGEPGHDGLNHRRKHGNNPDYDRDSNNPDGTVHMKRNVGLISGTSLIVGTIIGSGIFVSPAGVLGSTGSVGLSLTIWGASGLIALLGALSYVELGTLIAKSGGEYAYFYAAYGGPVAYLFAWTSVIVIRPSSIAIICLTFATYLNAFFDLCGGPSIPIKVTAAAAILTVTILNCYSTKIAAYAQVFFTAAKLIALGIMCVGGIVRLAQGHVEVLDTGYEGSTNNPSVIALAFYDALWAYDGWQNLNLVTEELKNPNRNLPLANIFGVILVTVVYMLTNISYFTAMTAQQLLDSDAVATTWADKVLGGAAIIIPLAVLFSTFGAANGTCFAGTRVVYAASRDGNLPEVLSYVHARRFTPMISIAFTAMIAFLMIIPADIGQLIDFFSFASWLFYGGAFLAFLVLRFRMKDAKRPVKIPFVIPLIMFLVACYLIIAPIIDNPQIELLYAAIFIIGGLVLYIPFVFFKLTIPGTDAVTLFIQLLCEVAPSPYEPKE